MIERNSHGAVSAFLVTVTNPPAGLMRPALLQVPYLVLVKAPAAVLLDVYETVLTCDFERHFRGLADAAGVDFDDWSPVLERFVPDLVRGHTTILEAFGRTLTACRADPARAPFLVERDVELIVECSSVFPDVLPAIRRWRLRGARVALVSNCVANTGPLLAALGLSAAVDLTVLSCDVGSVKPEPEIYLHAAAALEVEPSAAMFIDDQLAYCLGAQAVGMSAARVDRTGTATPTRGVLRSLAEVV